MNRFMVTDPWVFFGVGGAIVAYLLYMMIRRRQGEARVLRKKRLSSELSEGLFAMTDFFNRMGNFSSPVEFSSPLGLPSWFVLAGVPVGIIALYFLKLRRRPVRVPSTILWRRSLEDLHVNSLFQRLSAICSCFSSSSRWPWRCSPWPARA